jgi:hypothetical protein
VLAAVVVSHGAVLPIDERTPSLPADVATKMPAADAFMNARFSESVNGSFPLPPSEELMTSTPSRTARSMAATMSASSPVPSSPVLRLHSTL